MLSIIWIDMSAPLLEGKWCVPFIVLLPQVSNNALLKEEDPPTLLNWHTEFEKHSALTEWERDSMHTAKFHLTPTTKMALIPDLDDLNL